MLQADTPDQPFSFFASIGGTSFYNHEEVPDYRPSKLKNEPGLKVQYTAADSSTHKLVSCYCCYKRFDRDEATTVQSLPNKVGSLLTKLFCSKTCLNKEVDNLLQTCQVCFKLFEKYTGVPNPKSGHWVCSLNCRQNYKTNDILETNVMNLLEAEDRRAKEIQHQQQRKEAQDTVDLQFDYSYNQNPSSLSFFLC